MCKHVYSCVKPIKSKLACDALLIFSVYPVPFEFRKPNVKFMLTQLNSKLRILSILVLQKF